MIIAATFLKPRERRIREEGHAEGYKEGYKEGFEEGLAEARAERLEKSENGGAGRAEASAESDHSARLLEQERAAWRAWYERSELARAKGEKPPPPPFLCSCDCHQSG